MTYETGMDGVLTDAESAQLFLKAEPITAYSVVGALHQTWDGLRRVAQAQHQADIEKVKGLELLSPSGSIGPLFDMGWDACWEAVLKALGENK